MAQNQGLIRPLDSLLLGYSQTQGVLILTPSAVERSAIFSDATAAAYGVAGVQAAIEEGQGINGKLGPVVAGLAGPLAAKATNAFDYAGDTADAAQPYIEEDSAVGPIGGLYTGVRRIIEDAEDGQTAAQWPAWTDIITDGTSIQNADGAYLMEYLTKAAQVVL